MTAGRDLDLLDRLSQTSRALGVITAELRVCQVYDTPLNSATLRKTGNTLRSLGEALLARAAELDGTPPAYPGRCALCGAEPVSHPHAEAWMVENRFCADCIDHCLTDTHHDHWCPIDTFARAHETHPQNKARIDV